MGEEWVTKKQKFAPEGITLDSIAMDGLTFRLIATEIGLEDEDIEREFGNWQDHEFEKPKTHWVRVWRTWCRNSRKYSPSKPAGSVAKRDASILKFVKGGE